MRTRIYSILAAGYSVGFTALRFTPGAAHADEPVGGDVSVGVGADVATARIAAIMLF